MSDLRARPVDLCMSEAMPFQQSWQYRTTHSIKDIVNDEFFRPVQSMLRPGDSITICRFDSTDERSKSLTEFATARVVSSAADAVRLVLAGDIVAVPKQRATVTPESNGAVYSAKKQFGGGFVVEDDKGNAIEVFKTKVEAEEHVALLNGQQKAA